MGRPYQKLNLYDSNPGQVKLSLGGVARNIAENAVKMNAEVYLMSLFGKARGDAAYPPVPAKELQTLAATAGYHLPLLLQLAERLWEQEG